MKKKTKISGTGDGSDIMDAVIGVGALSVGVIVAQEGKALLPAPTAGGMFDPATTLGKAYPWIVNGAGIAVGLALPMVTDDPDIKKPLRAFGLGVAGQCVTSLYTGQIRKTSVSGWNTYALGRNKVGLRNTYALGNQRSFSVPGVGSRAFDVNGNPIPGQQVKKPTNFVKTPKRAVGGF